MCGERAGAVFCARERGERHRGHVPAAIEPQRAHALEQRVAVVTGHRQIAHEHVGARACERVERFLRRGGRHHLRARLAEDGRDQVARVRVVVDDQDADAGERR